MPAIALTPSIQAHATKEKSDGAATCPSMDVIVMIQLTGWLQMGDVIRSLWYSKVMRRLSMYLDKIAVGPVKILEVYIQSERTLLEMREIRRGRDEKIFIWETRWRTELESANAFCRRMAQQKNSITYILITDRIQEDRWSFSAFWSQVIQEDRVQDAHVICYNYVAKPCQQGNTYSQSLDDDDVYQGEPDYCLHVPGPAPLQAERALELYCQSLPDPQSWAETGKENSMSSDDDGENDDAAIQASLCTCSSLSGKPASKKGDDFLSFLERAAAIYKEV